ncbi:hypothetical protein [Pedobacter sp. ASV28]|uniref:hypothetical protein n=1 Tax=Pedobacter sp. ASV28 TaxID=2795123 RepID=UPI0018EC72DF|nr:hypothetical protein [Pedobacter sp. ASV28]
MKKQSVLLMLLAVLFTASVTTSCKKSSDSPKEEEEKPGTGNPNLSRYLKGSDYYLITLDASSEKNIHSKVKKDYRTDDVNSFLYVWDNTYLAGSSSGPNSFGEVEGWTSLVVNNIGWSGCGFVTATTIKADLSGVTDQHVLHFAMKGKDNASHMIILNDGTKDVKIVIGATPFVDNGVNYQPYKNFTRNGEWQHIEVPMSYLKDQGLRYTSAGFNANIVAILSGGTAGTTLDIDGIFFYKPAQ